MDKTYYILYQVTNNLNGKIYVGVHKTKKLDDGYMGSGKIICSAIAKHGIANFSKVILEQFENSAAMYAREKEVVTDEFLAREDTYNLRRGGFGGFEYINRHCGNQGERLNNYLSQEKRILGSRRGVESRKRNKTDVFADDYVSPFSNKELLEEMHRRSALPEAISKRKETYAKIGHSKGEKNSQFGSKWITDEISNRKINKDDPVPEGWRTGRKMK